MIMMSIRHFALATAATLLVCASAQAQSGAGRLPVQQLNFDLWCQETVKLPLARCQKRMPEDMQRFETYRATIERYEIPDLKSKDGQRVINRSILGSDPTTAPISKSPAAQDQVPSGASAPGLP